MDGIESRDVVKVSASNIVRQDDLVTDESALAISVNTFDGERFELGVTMRTKGHDEKLVVGFLYSEGIINSLGDIVELQVDNDIAHVSLNENSRFDPELHCRRGTVTSACGICGRSTIGDSAHIHGPELDEDTEISIDIIEGCLGEMRTRQEIFSRTGGSHACASFDSQGELDRIFEDVGRHNALDKLVGSYLLEDAYPMERILFVSGRASFELVQKSIRIGFPIMIAIGAPSTLAIDIANEHGQTLGCFARNQGITVYSGFRRVSEC